MRIAYRIVLGMLIVSLLAELAWGQVRVEKNVVFGMYSGLALLMDVHRPAEPNGYAVIVVPGSGWNSKQTYDATPLTALQSSIRFFVPKMLDAGYTLFVVNHRSAPRFHYPSPVEDVQRAVRFIRYNAAVYGINPTRIGALGHSSGAHLSALLGVLDTKEDPNDPDPVNRVSARVQCVVASATQTDLTAYISAASTLFMGQVIASSGVTDPIALDAYRAASPITHVSHLSAPMLLLHGDADATVPFQMAERMREAMTKAGVDVKVIPLPGGTHGYAGETANHPEWPNVFTESVRWMDQHLRPPGSH